MRAVLVAVDRYFFSAFCYIFALKLATSHRSRLANTIVFRVALEKCPSRSLDVESEITKSGVGDRIGDLSLSDYMVQFRREVAPWICTRSGWFL
jgi:hypothetical protein